MINTSHKQFITQTIQYIILLTVFNYFWGAQLWYQNKLRDTLLLIFIYIVFLLIGWLSFLFRPIHLKIKQTNSLGEGIPFTLLTVEGSKKASLLQRTVKMSIDFERKGSIWWKLLLYILKEKDVYLVIQPTPRQLVLQPAEQFQNQEIMVDGKHGFKLFLNDLITEVGQLQSKEAAISKTYLYSVIDHPDITIPESLTATVIPSLYINDKPINWLKILIKIETEEQQIRFFRR